MRFFVTAAVASLLSIASAGAQSGFDAMIANWSRPQAPFRVIGNIYYVGTAELASYLIVSPQGDVLIDGTLQQTAPQIEANIKALGFRLSDVKLILNSHAHFDHAAGIAQIKKDSGARFDASAGDAPILERGYITYGPSAPVHFPPVKVDHIVQDGETVGFGAAKLTAHLTPGHTPGCTTWTMPVTENGVTHHAVFICSVTVAGNPLVNNTIYPQIGADYRASFARLKQMQADVFLGPHVEFFDMQKKLAARKAGGPNPFIDAKEFQAFVAQAEQDFDKDLAQQEAAAKK
ncbi:MAG TPA: subclass B3 metallo-beta-lactamase [Rhizomicrobium sp.]|nr:subclass B3 metallo-beta-lactamase [Rhizomicrobium sp.]